MRDADHPDLGTFLRRRRALVEPPATSGARGARRRVPGLRRQELAELASISVEYYTRLEQGRAPRPSREVLAALARACALTVPERDHLYRLAGELPPEPSAPSAVVRPGLLRLLDRLSPAVPVTVHDGRLDVVAANASATALFGPVDVGGRFGRNVVHRAFTTSALTDLLDADGADRLHRVAAAELRVALSRYPDDPYLRDLLADLLARSADFRDRWDRGEVGAWRSALKRVRHPEQGWVDLDVETLHDPERDHWVMLYTPADDPA